MASEQTPLLKKQNDDVTDAFEDLDTTTALHEAKIIFTYIVPVTASGVLRYVCTASSIFFVSKLGTTALAGANLGIMTANVFGFSVIIGLITALDTLANQSSRSVSPKLTCLYAWRSFVVCCSVMPLIYIILFNCGSIFTLILPGADQEMIALASSYCKIACLSLPAVAAFECIRRYLAAFGLVAGPTYAYCVATPVALICNYLLILGPDNLRIGYPGAAVSVVVAHHFLLVIILVYCAIYSPRHTLVPLNRKIFQDLRLNYKYGLLGVATVTSEWLAFEYCSLAASYLGVEAQATNSIFMTIMGFLYQIPFSMSVAAAIRVGNLLGENKPKKAKMAAFVSQVMGVTEVVITSIFLFIFRRQIMGIFSQDPDVIDQAEKIIWVLVVTVVADGTQGVNTGILKDEFGWQSKLCHALSTVWLILDLPPPRSWPAYSRCSAQRGQLLDSWTSPRHRDLLLEDS